MIFPRVFTQAPDNNFEELAPAAGRLRALQQAMAQNTLPTDYTPADIAAYAESLLAFQREDGSFSVSKNPDELEPDVKTDSLRFVTWTAAAFLHLLETRLPETAAQIPGLRTSITRALNSLPASHLNFPESGPAAPVQQIEAVLILCEGEIPGMLEREPAAAPALKAALHTVTAEFRRCLESGETSLAGAIDYAPLYKMALEALAEHSVQGTETN